MDRSSLGNEITITLADGTTSELDSLNGDENTFILDVSSEFDFMGFSHDPAYTDDSEVVVLEGAVGSGDRSIIFGESNGETEDWDVVSFNGLDSGVTLDLSQLINSDYEAVATNSTAQDCCL